MKLTLNDRVAVVTGAARGLGFEMARELAAGGMSVALVDINAEALAASAATLVGEGGAAEAFPCDIADNAAIANMVEAVAKRFGGIDVIVNCAGIMNSTPIADVTREEWDKMLSINLGGGFFVIQACLPYLKKSRAGRVVNISSNAGRMGGYENSMTYTASKGGLISLTFGLARQLAPFGITVNAVCPGPVATEMVKNFQGGGMERMLARIPLGRFGTPKDNAAAVCYLASEEAGFVTGVLLDVNGGLYMG